MESDPHARARTAQRGARRQRAVRGVVASAVATSVAGAAHTLAGAGAPPWWLLVAATLLASPLAVVMVGRRSSVRGTAAAVVSAQVLLHAAFATVGSHAPLTTGAHTSHTVALPAATPAAHLHLDAGMILAHLIAAALTVLLVTRGETAIRQIARGITLGIRRRTFPPRPVAITVPAPIRGIEAAPLSDVLLSALSRRGPPAFAR